MGGRFDIWPSLEADPHALAAIGGSQGAALPDVLAANGGGNGRPTDIWPPPEKERCIQSDA